MPIYEYACKECEHEFEALVYGSQKAACPKCSSKKLAPKLSVFAVSRLLLPGLLVWRGLAEVAATRADPAPVR